MIAAAHDGGYFYISFSSDHKNHSQILFFEASVSFYGSRFVLKVRGPCSLVVAHIEMMSKHPNLLELLPMHVCTLQHRARRIEQQGTTTIVHRARTHLSVLIVLDQAIDHN